MKKLIALIALGAGIYYLQAKEFLSTYKVKFFSGRLNKDKTRDSGYRKIYFDIKMRIENKTGFTGTLQSGLVILSYKGKIIGTAKAAQPITISREDGASVLIPAAIDSLKLIGSIPEMFAMITQTQKINFHLDGYLKFNIGQYKINENYTVSI